MRRVAAGLMLMLMLGCATSGVTKHQREDCAVLHVDNQNFSDAVVWFHGERVGDVTGLTSASFRLCGSALYRHAIFGVHLIGGQTWPVDAMEDVMPGREYILIIRGVPSMSVGYPAA